MHYVPDRPEDEEEQPILFCDECNGDIYKGDWIYELEDDNICENCLHDYFEIRKVKAGRGDL